MDKQELNKALAKAKIGLMAKDSTVFWSTVCMGLNHHFDESIPTACTDGINIKYNPKFFMEECKSNEERTGLVFHENGHVVLRHMDRRGERDPQLYNIAGDHVINIMGAKAGFTFPEGAIMDMKYDGWSTEQIYDDLIQDPPPEAPDFQCDVDFDNPPDADDANAAGQQLDDLLVKAVMAAQAANQIGSVPGEVQRYVDNLLNPRIPWDAILRRFMTKFDKSRYNYKVPNRRFFPGIFVPKRKSEALQKIAIAIDASASVDDHQFENYVSGTHQVLRQYNPQSLEFLQFTTRITSKQEIKSVRDLKKMEFIGRGGTSVEPLMQWAKEERPSLLIVFSDGHFRVPDTLPKVPVIWIIHDNPGFTMPFGKVIHFDIV